MEVKYYKELNKVRIAKNNLNHHFRTFETTGSPEDLYKVHRSVVVLTRSRNNVKKLLENNKI